MDREAWWAAVHGVGKSRTRLSDFTFTFHFHALEKEMATHSSVLAWRIPGTAEPRGLLSMGSHRVGHDWRNLATAATGDIQAFGHNLKLSREMQSWEPFVHGMRSWASWDSPWVWGVERKAGPGASLRELHVRDGWDDEGEAKDSAEVRGWEETRKIWRHGNWRKQAQKRWRELSIVPICAENSSNVRTEKCPLDVVHDAGSGGRGSLIT